MNFKVQKKDGSTEDFDRSKIVNGLTKAGVALAEAESVAGQVEGWLQAIAGGVIKSVDLRSKVLELLRVVNPSVASRFESYKKPV